jgi:hypothetical protein
LPQQLLLFCHYPRIRLNKPTYDSIFYGFFL